MKKKEHQNTMFTFRLKEKEAKSLKAWAKKKDLSTTMLIRMWIRDVMMNDPISYKNKM